MGIFSKIKEAVAGTEADAIADAKVGRGVIVAAKVSGTQITIGTIEYHVCSFEVEVTLDDTAPYHATCRQRLPVWRIAQIQPGASVVAVRVDVADPSRVAIDWDSPVPTVRLQSSPGGSAAEVLANGLPCRVIVQQFQALNMTNAVGVPVYAFALTVMPEHGQPYMTQVGNPVPTEALPFLFPGAQLPAKVQAGDPSGVVIDWSAASAPASA